MHFRFLVSEAIHAIRSNALRSVLTIVGIVVGIFSVTAMLALGEGMSANVLDRFSSFMQGDITISGDVTYHDFTWMSEKPYVEHTLASVQVQQVSVVAFDAEFSPTVQAVVGDYTDVQKYTIVSGEVFDFTDPSFAEPVAVVSDGFSDAVTKETGRSVLGQNIRIGSTPYTVVGVIESSSMTFTRGDGLVLVPHATMVGNLTNNKSFSSVAVTLKDSSYFDIAGQDILYGLNASRQLAVDSDEVFSVETSQSMIETAQQTTAMLSMFLGIVGGIALFVGGIGTMNMMLTTVTERTKEIGLRKAIGARDKDILLQILIESVVLTTLGGIIGIALSLGVAKIANTIFANSEIISVMVNMKVIALAAIVSILVGVVFGIYPARNASRLQPVDALRAEEGKQPKL
jgi:putative ABC transport system permease protein